MKLSKLLSAIHVVDTKNFEDIHVPSIEYHSKKIQEGALFVCIKGYQTDGHQYLPAAIKSGAKVAIVETFTSDDVIQILVEDSRIALALLADCFYEHPSRDLTLIGITATNGKTTTSFMMDKILEANQLKTGLIGTVVVKIGDQSEMSALTTPESLDLHHFFRKMLDQSVTHTTMEVSSSALELNRSAGADFDVVALNNISREHIDNHGSFEAYYNFKASLIRNVKATGKVILNLDDPYCKQLENQTKGQVFTYGVNDPSGHVSISELDLSTGIANFNVHLKGLPYEEKTFKISLSIPGYHCVYNSLAAITIALSMNVPIEAIQKGVRDFKGIERRFECIFDDDYKIYDDHFANSGNIDVTLETLDLMTYNDFQLLYAIRGSRGVTVNKENAETIVKWAKKLNLTEIIACKSKAHVIWKDVVTDDEEAVFLQVMAEANIKVTLYDELPDAIDLALQKTKKDDVLLLAGCQGMDYGCNIILNKLESLRPDIDRMVLRKPLETRVAGLLEGIIHE